MTHTTERPHHPIGMSRGLWLATKCPGWPEIAKTLHAIPPTGDMERGIELHAYVESRLLGREPAVTGLGSYDRYIAERAVEWHRELVATTEGYGYPLLETRTEERVDLKAGSRVLTYSYADALSLFGEDPEKPEGALLVDWKFYVGARRLRTMDICQLTAMAAAVLQAYPSLDGVSAYAYYPYLDEEVRWIVTRDELSAYEVRFHDIFLALSDGEVSPGTHCSQCPAVHGCPKASGTERAPALHAPDAYGEILRYDQATDEVTILDERRAWELLTWWSSAEQRMREIRRLLSIAVERAGGETEYLRLQQNGSTRSFSDKEQAWDRLDERARERLKPQLTPSQVERALKDAGMSAREAKSFVEQTLGDLIRETPKAASLKPKTRPEDA